MGGVIVTGMVLSHGMSQSWRMKVQGSQVVHRECNDDKIKIINTRMTVGA